MKRSSLEEFIRGFSYLRGHKINWNLSFVDEDVEKDFRIFEQKVLEMFLFRLLKYQKGRMAIQKMDCNHPNDLFCCMGHIRLFIPISSLMCYVALYSGFASGDPHSFFYAPN